MYNKSNQTKSNQIKSNQINQHKGLLSNASKAVFEAQVQTSG
jgi:hypothetical protein